MASLLHERNQQFKSFKKGYKMTFCALPLIKHKIMYLFACRLKWFKKIKFVYHLAVIKRKQDVTKNIIQDLQSRRVVYKTLGMPC